MKDIAKLYEELRSIIDGGSESFTHEDAVQYLKDKLAQPEQEPMAWMCHPFGDDEVEYGPHKECENCIPLYTTPPQRTWVGLTDERIDYIYDQLVAGQLESIEEQEDDPMRIFARAIEAAHGIKEKNT